MSHIKNKHFYNYNAFPKGSIPVFTDCVAFQRRHPFYKQSASQVMRLWPVVTIPRPLWHSTDCLSTTPGHLLQQRQPALWCHRLVGAQKPRHQPGRSHLLLLPKTHSRFRWSQRTGRTPAPDHRWLLQPLFCQLFGWVLRQDPVGGCGRLRWRYCCCCCCCYWSDWVVVWPLLLHFRVVGLWSMSPGRTLELCGRLWEGNQCRRGCLWTADQLLTASYWSTGRPECCRKKKKREGGGYDQRGWWESEFLFQLFFIFK